MKPVAVAREAVERHGALQKADELAGLLALLEEWKPSVIVELGCDAGGTLWAWRHAFPEAAVCGVTLDGGAWSSGRVRDATIDAHVIVGNTHDDATLAELQSWLDGREVDVLMIDADHSVAGATSDFAMYSPLVRRGGAVVFHDILPHRGRPQVAVHRVWEHIRAVAGARTFEIVREPLVWGGIGIFVP